MKGVYKTIENYYTSKVLEHGATPAGVDWNGTESQYLRFEKLAGVIRESKKYSINDLGCGYGELVSFLDSQGFRDYTYNGYDLSESMVATATKSYSDNHNANFKVIADSCEMTDSDFVVASGIFNTKQHHSNNEWYDYMMYTLSTMNQVSRKGFSFNALTKYSDPEKMQADLFYADPCVLFDHCKRNYSKNVALLHDYDLYEFTLIIRK